jgi:uncharacterized zinc-type alcohol dehydrogenase-like protein
LLFSGSSLPDPKTLKHLTMQNIQAFAAHSATTPLGPHTIHRREPGPQDVEIDIRYCGVCHSDIHQARNEWGGSSFPMVPGHEIVGVVTRVGEKVSRFKAGDLAGIGCFVDSCRTCYNCKSGEEQFCENGAAWTYNGTEMDRKTPTYGGYSTLIVTDEQYTLKVSPKLDLAGVAPLLCAGITTYSPLRHWKVGKGSKVAIFGLGGLGHMGVKFAAAFGAEVTVLSTSRAKEADARRMGAHDFVVIGDDAEMAKRKNHFNFILNTVSAHHDYNKYLGLLALEGTMTLVGVPPEHIPVSANALIGRRRNLSGSLIGGIRETQEMLDFCAEKNIVSDIELIPIQQINEAYERMIRSDVRYRFVIDIASLKN